MAEKPAVVKGALKFKSTASSQKKTTVEMAPKNQGKPTTAEQKHKEQVEKAIQPAEQEKQGKTAAEKAFQIAKKTRLIHKETERSRLSMKERIEKRNKILSKLPDHEDLFKTGEKIQKGY